MNPNNTYSSIFRAGHLLDCMPMAVVIVNAAGMVESMNVAAQQLLGVQAAPGVEFRRFFTDGDGDDALSFIDILKVGAVPRTIELTARNAQGKEFPCEMTVSHLARRNREYFVTTLQDVTKRREVEKLRRELTAMVSHDLRAPLTSLLGSMSLLSIGALGNLPDEARGVVSTAECEIERLQKLVTDLLDVARIESGRLPLAFSDCSLQNLVDRSVKSLSSLACQKNITIQTEVPALRLSGDEDRLLQVVINLLANAIQASRKGAIIRVTAECVNGWITVRVRDYAGGIAQQELERIFNSHVRLSNDSNGTGLGLAICKAIVEQHGGRIGVDSTVGKGSTFWIKLPAQQGIPLSTPVNTFMSLQWNMA